MLVTGESMLGQEAALTQYEMLIVKKHNGETTSHQRTQKITIGASD